MTVKKWFLEKAFTQNERYAIDTTEQVSIVRETEKAVLIKWVTDFGTIQRWVPKSCVESFDAPDAPEAVELQVGMDVVNGLGERFTIAKIISSNIIQTTSGKILARIALKVA